MKRNIQYLLAALCMAVAGSFIGCSQEDEFALNRLPGSDEELTDDASATRGGEPVVCSIKTDTLGQVQAKVKAFVDGGGTSVVENITDLYIEGPINQTDINYIKTLKYLDSLSIEKADVYDGEGKQTSVLASECFAEMKAEAAVYLPKSVSCLGACCFREANIRAIYMDYVDSLGVEDRNTYYDLYDMIRYDDIANGWTLQTGGFQFIQCTKLNTVRLSNQLTELSPWMFAGCSSLKRLDLPSSVTYVGRGVFLLSGLEEFSMNNISYVGYQAFRSCKKLKTVIVSDKLVRLSPYTFKGCTSLKQIELPSSVKEIEEEAFAESGLEEFTMSDYLLNIGPSVFSDCASLKKVIPSNSVKTIGDYAFYNCDALTEFTFPDIREMGSGVLRDCNNLETVVWPERIDNIPAETFIGCSKLNFEIPDYVTSIGDYAFADCDFTEFTIPKSVESIGQRVFINCYNLSDISLSEGLNRIGEEAFYNCKNLRHIVIPSTVSSMARHILTGCIGLTDIRWLSKTDVYLLFSDKDYGINPNLLLYVPEGVKVTRWADNPDFHVIRDGKIKRLVLVQSRAFYCPEPFTAEKVEFQEYFGYSNYEFEDFGKWYNVYTGSGEPARWNTLVLPFTVTSITSEGKGELAPFGSDEVANGQAKPFWLCEMTSEGFKGVQTIEAHKPYLYAMPNNPNYLDEYNIQDMVSFSAENVTIEKTPDELSSSPTGPAGWALTPTYSQIDQQSNIYNINWRGFYDTDDVWHPVGNCFRSNVRATNAFEAYVKLPASTRAEYISLGGKAITRTKRQLGRIPQREDMPMPW